MNVEKAIEHILQIQAAAEGRVDKAERQIDAIRKLLRTGMKLVVDIGEAQKAGDQKMAALAAAQAITEKKLASFIDALKRIKTNGHN